MIRSAPAACDWAACDSALVTTEPRIVSRVGIGRLDAVCRTDPVGTECRQGEPYHPEPIRAVEAHSLGEGRGGGFPPFARRQPWSGRSLALAIGHAVLGGLREAGLLRGRYDLHAGERAGGYVRLFIENAEEADSALFAASLEEALGPLRRPRYVIPRYADEVCETWLSTLMPELLARYFRKRNRRMAMLHAVPSALAKNRELAEIYARHWNAHVSPGQPVYTYHGEGQRLVEEARRDGQIPESKVRDKEFFL